MHDQRPPNRPDHTKRSKPERLASLLAAALTLGGWGALAWWMLGRVLSDRFAWSQWARWTPTELVVLVCLGLITAALILKRFAGPGSKRRQRALFIAWTGVFAWMILIQWRTHALAGRILFGQPVPAITAMSWNATGATGPTLHEAIPDRPLDLLVVTNPLAKVDWSLVTQKMGPGATATGLGRAKIVTKLDILRWGSTDLGMDGRVSATRQEGRWFDRGWAGFFELDTTADLGQTTVIWLVDLPSDLALPRTEMASTAADVIHAWPGPALATFEGVPTVEPLDSPGFPEPDIIIGDFNIPRGSHSLSAIAGSLTNAWSDFGLGGGIGPLGSWPRTKPVFHIDQTFLARELRSCSYELLDLGVGKHRAQVVGIAKRK